jgi:hypothetical protein
VTLIHSVVQRAMYLLKELKSPDERYQEIYGFDESHARGRPTENLEEHANIPENIKDYEATIQLDKRITTQVETLTKLHDLLQSNWSREGIYEFLRDGYDNPPAINIGVLRRKLETFPNREYIDSLTISSDILKDVDLRWNETEPTRAEKLRRMEEWYSRIPPQSYFSQQIAKLEKERRKLCRLTPEVAYLQACSEFYLLRQQEQLETRIAIEQARCFRKKFDPSVNEMEMAREQIALSQWAARAEKQQSLMVDARRSRASETTRATPTVETEEEGEFDPDAENENDN